MRTDDHEPIEVAFDGPVRCRAGKHAPPALANP
jgi:hypothetical protein